MHESKIAIIIVTYNGEDWLSKCILPLYDLDKIDIIVVDNNSSDNTVNLLKANYPKVIVIESDINLGFGKANNIGFNFAIKNNYDFVFLLNQDASIDKINLNKLIEEYLKLDDVGILSPIHFKNENEIENIFKSYIKDNKIDSNTVGQDLTKEVEFVNAALWLISVENLKLFGGFNSTFHHYGEDVEYVNRVNFFKKKTYIHLNSKGYHFRDYDIKAVREKSSTKRHFGPWHNKYYIILLNNNFSLMYAFYLIVRLFTVNLLKHLLKFNFNSAKWDIKIFRDIISQLPMILKNRRINTEHKSFLNNE